MAKYIDADAVIEELRQIYNDCDDWKDHISQSDLAESEKRILTTRASATKMAMIEVRLRVDKMPSADVVERKKGKWKMEWHSFFHREIPMCSQCLRVSAFKYNFCPYCGAEMREEKDNVGSNM